MKTSMSSKPRNNNHHNSFIKYSGLAAQMGGVIFLGVYLGKYLDDKFDTDKVFTLILSLLSVIGSMYIAIKSVIDKK